MINYHEILRLSNLGLNKSQIAQNIGYSMTTVIQVLNIAEEKWVCYPLSPELTDRKLTELLFLSDKSSTICSIEHWTFQKMGSKKRKRQKSNCGRICRQSVWSYRTYGIFICLYLPPVLLFEFSRSQLDIFFKYGIEKFNIAISHRLRNISGFLFVLARSRRLSSIRTFWRYA